MPESTARAKRNLANYLRELARRGQHGHSRSPGGYIMLPSYTCFYWDNHGVVPDHVTWERVAALSARYRRYLRYMREIRPQWRETERIYWADNSIEAVQVSDVTGETRRVMVAAPSGDACF